MDLLAMARKFSIAIAVALLFSAIALLTCMNSNSTFVLYLCFFAQRIAAILLVACVGRLIGRDSKVTVALSCLAIVLADMAWLGFHLAIGASNNLADYLINPLVPMTLVICVATCATNRIQSLAAGFGASLILPVIGALWFLSQLSTEPGVRGTGLASVLIVTTAAMAIPFGVLATLLLRCIYETVFQRRNVPSPETSAI